ncbi:permease prefix domain 1-containing protein [Alkalibacterium sp. f15]|uniref:permease prefix domain 1-containing protein n=1 Tax=Alkalibacterium sp. f15 TaxID=3414029 RepID=UPI003BF8E333
MNTIREYIEQMFKGVPMNDETTQLKADILANLEDKYLALKEGGATEHEAIGVVIAEFGDIDELLEEFGVSRVNKKVTAQYTTMSSEDLARFVEAKARMGLNVGLGVLACLSGIAGLLLLLAFQGMIPGALYLGLLLMVTLAVIGIGLFIIEGMKAKDFKPFYSPFIIMPTDKEWIQDDQDNYKRSFIFSIVAGVSLCIMSLTPVLMGALTPMIPVLVGVGFMLILIGTGIIFFTYSGNVWSAYGIILTNGKYIESIEIEAAKDERNKKVNYILEEIYWPIIVVIYLVFSFLQGAWAWSWIIFILAGALESTIKSLAGNWEN